MQLGEILEHTWRLLEEGLNDPKHAMHWPVLATENAREPGLPSVRTVVLRNFNKEPASLQCYTDDRAEKVSDLQRNENCVWHAYDSASRVQLRMRARAELHQGDELARQAWRRDGHQGRPLYQAWTTPGTAVASWEESQRKDEAPHEEGAGFPHFAVVVAYLQHIDYLQLLKDGQIRAGFTRQGEDWHGQWLVP